MTGKISIYMGTCTIRGMGFSDMEDDQHFSGRSLECETCDLWFWSEDAMIERLVQSPRHFYCRSCDEQFYGAAQLDTHYSQDHHWCQLCREIFYSELALREHNRQKHELPRVGKFRCPSCKKSFASESNLRAHQNSTTHLPRIFMCNRKGCEISFVSEAALALHWESGTCKSGITRDVVNRTAIKHDRNNTITDSCRLSSNNPAGSPSSVRVASPESITPQSFQNGHAYECPICHKEFRIARALIAHLKSPVHQQKIYRCPRVWEGCGTELKTLSGLLQHVDSQIFGVCRFKTRQVVGSLVDGLKKVGI